MNLRHAPWGLAEGTNLPSVDRFGDRQRIHVVEGLPTKSEEFAGPERIGHVQHQQNAIPPSGCFEDRSQLLRRQDLFVLRPEIFRNLQRPGRVLDEELLLDCFVEHGLEIRACLLHPILAVGLCQMVHMRLELKLVDRLHWVRAELRDQINLNLSLLLYCSLRSPIPLSYWEVAIANEPLEGDRAIFENSSVCNLAGLLRNLSSKRFARCGLRHIRLKAEPNADANRSDILCLRIDDLLAIEAIPSLPAKQH